MNEPQINLNIDIPGITPTSNVSIWSSRWSQLILTPFLTAWDFSYLGQKADIQTILVTPMCWKFWKYDIDARFTPPLLICAVWHFSLKLHFTKNHEHPLILKIKIFWISFQQQKGWKESLIVDTNYILQLLGRKHSIVLKFRVIILMINK